MFIVESYGLAVALCWVTMLCWGSWGILKNCQPKHGAMNCSIGIM